MAKPPKKGLEASLRARQAAANARVRPPSSTVDAALAAKANDIARASVIREATSGIPGLAPPVDEVDIQALRKERAILSAALLEEKRELGKADFWYFITETMFPDVWQKHYSENFQGMMACEIQALAPGESLWFFVFRSARKSYLCNILHTWWRIVRDPNIRIMLVGAREETVKPFARLILQPFIPGALGFEEFQRVYPDFVFSDARGANLRQAYQFTHPLRTKALADPTFRATYLGVTGAGWRNDLTIFDDCIERRNVANPEQSAKALRNMLDLTPLLDMTGDYRMTVGLGTPRVFHEPYARIMGIEQPGSTTDEAAEIADQFIGRSKVRVIVRHALEHPTTPCDDCPPRIVAMYPHGKFSIEEGIPPDFPVHTREMILSEYEKYATDPDRGESLFYHEYGVIYKSPKDQKFKEEWFITAPFPYFAVHKKRVLTVDAADKDFQKENTGDWMVALFGEFDDFGRLLLVHGLRSRAWTRAVFQDAIIAWCKGTGWWPHVAAKEKFAEGGSFLSDLGARFWEHQKPVHVVPVLRPSFGGQIGGMKKMDYIVGNLQAPMERAEIIFGSAFPPALKERARQELLSLGQLRNDDVADSLALFMDPAVRLVSVAQMAGPPQEWRGPDLASYGHPAPIAQAMGNEAARDPMGYALRVLTDAGHFQAIPEIGFTERGQGPDKPPPGGYHIILPG